MGQIWMFVNVTIKHSKYSCYVREQTYAYAGGNLMSLRNLCSLRLPSFLIISGRKFQVLRYESESCQYYFNMCSSDINAFVIFYVCNFRKFNLR
jgi:hypothetical protein